MRNSEYGVPNENDDGAFTVLADSALRIESIRDRTCIG